VIDDAAEELVDDVDEADLVIDERIDESESEAAPAAVD
jgi:hypothetical protein